MSDPVSRRAPALRRSWLFLPGADGRALEDAPASGADVLIQELEDFTPPDQRDAARAMAEALYPAWRAAGCLAAVRINPLESGGLDDLPAVMRGRPDVVAMSKVATAAQVVALDAEVTRLESALGLPAGSTELAPNIESALGLHNAFAIATASPRVRCVLGSTEDTAMDLGAPRSREGWELQHGRQRLLLECVAAGVTAVDCPWTFADAQGCGEDALWARRLGYVAKTAVDPAHIAEVNRVMTPSTEEIAAARRMVTAFEAARAMGQDRARAEGLLVEVPSYTSALRLLERARALGVA